MISAWLVMGMTLLALSSLPFASMRARIDAFAGDGSADPYTPQLHRRLQITAMLGGVASMAASLFLWKRRLALVRRTEACTRRFHADAAATLRVVAFLGRDCGTMMIVVTAAALAVRIPHLHVPMRYDEAYTFLLYASEPWFVTITRYDAPNNHVFHSVCVSIATWLFGDDPWTIRTPAFLAGVLLAPISSFLGRCWQDRAAGWISGLAVAGASQLIEYSVNARGYTILAVLVVVSVLLTELIVRRANLFASVLFVVAMALGFWTVPTMLYAAAAIGAYVALRGWTADWPRARKQHYWRRWRLLAASTGVAVLVLYSPILLVNGPSPWTTDLQAEHEAPSGFFARLPYVVAEYYDWATYDLPWGVPLLAAAGLLIFFVDPGNPKLTFRRQTLAACAVPVMVSAFQRIQPPPRVWLFAMPLIFVAAGCGLSSLANWLGYARRYRSDVSTPFSLPAALLRGMWTTVFALVFFAVPVAVALRHDPSRQAIQLGICPEAAAIIDILRPELREDEPIIAVAPVSAPLIYYARRSRLAERHFVRPTAPQGKAFLLVTKNYPQTVSRVLEELGLTRLFDAKTFEVWREFPTVTIYRRPAESGSLLTPSAARRPDEPSPQFGSNPCRPEKKGIYVDVFSAIGRNRNRSLAIIPTWPNSAAARSPAFP